MRRYITLIALTAAVFAAATSCRDRFKTDSDNFVTSYYIFTKGVDISSNDAKTAFIADMHATLTSAVDLSEENAISKMAQREEIGFEYGKDPKFGGEVITVHAEQIWGEEEDPTEWRGFSGRAGITEGPLPPSQVYYCRAFVIIDGKKEYGQSYSFRTDDAMVVGVTLDRDKVTLTVTESIQLTATVYPTVAINKEVEWASDRESVASVSPDGFVTALSPGDATITVTTKEGGKSASCKVVVKGADPTAVDLGLSVKWADFNLGASKPSDTGNYYRWGDTYIPNEYSTVGYRFYYGRETVPTTSIASGAYDAAYDNLGSPWRMPTKEQFTELKESCSWTKETVDGIAGWRVSGNGNSIFLPFVGYRQGKPDNTPGLGSTGFYWTANYASGPEYQQSAKAWEFRINEEGQEFTTGFGHNGHAIRPVRP